MARGNGVVHGALGALALVATLAATPARVPDAWAQAPSASAASGAPVGAPGEQAPPAGSAAPASAAPATDAAPAADPPAPVAFDESADWFGRVRSGVGLLVMIAIAFALSTSRKDVRWRLVGMGVALQLVLGLFTLTAPGRWVFSTFNDVVAGLLGFTEAGATFLFGELAKPTGNNLGAYFVFGVLPTIVFFSSLMAVAYHLGLMQRLVRVIAAAMQKTMGTSGAETLSAAGNIFVGQTEAPLLVRPFIHDMTTSELMAVMTGGFATVAGGVLAAYVGMLRTAFPDIAGHLLSASIMSAPAALVVAKVMIPEPDPTASKTYGKLDMDLKSEDANVIDAAARGAGDGLQLALNVGAMLLAFIALIAMLNAGVGWVAGLAGYEGITLEKMLGWFLSPLAWIMGVPWEDAKLIGSLLGVKTVINEFVAYLQLADRASELHHLRSMLIASYALCGFANFGSIAIQLGGIAGIAPERRSDLARIGLRAMIGGTLAAFMTACVVGMVY